MTSEDQKLFVSAHALRYYIPIVLGIQVVHVFYSNLLINLRFKTKMRCYTCGYLLFDVLNFLCCYRFLKPVCRDKCCSLGTAIKWVLLCAIYAAGFGFNYHLSLVS